MKISGSTWLRSGLLLIITLNFTACGWLFGDGGMFRDRSENYRKARVEEELKVPDGMEEPTMEGNYAIPPISDQSKLEGEFEVPRPESMVEDAERDNVRINKLGSEQWILVNLSPGELWPRLRAFFNLNKITLNRTDASSGLMETVWLQPAAEGSLKERYRLRIEQGVQRATSEIYVLQADTTAGKETWPTVSSNTQREASMVDELSQYLADSTAVGSVSMLAQQAIDSSGRVNIEQPKGSEPYLKLDLPFVRAWASMDLAVQKAGFRIDDLNRSQMILYVNYTEGESEEDEGGWFSWLCGSDDDAVSTDYLIKMREISSDSVVITIHRPDDAPMQEGEASRLLKLIKKYLS